MGWRGRPWGLGTVSAEAVALWAHRGCCRSSGDRREGAGPVGRSRGSEPNRPPRGQSLGRQRDTGRAFSRQRDTGRAVSRQRDTGRAVSRQPFKSRLMKRISVWTLGGRPEAVRSEVTERAAWGRGRGGKVMLPWGSPSEITDPQVRVVWSDPGPQAQRRA